MNISHTCCVSLVGFNWGPSPSLLCMNVGLNIHQMLSQKLYPLLSTAHECRNRPPSTDQRNLNTNWTCCLRHVAVDLFWLHFCLVWGGGYFMLRECMDREGVTLGQSSASPTSTCHIVIACREPLHPSSPRRTPSCCCAHSQCHRSFLHVSGEWWGRGGGGGGGGPQGYFLMHGSSYMF